MMKRVVARRAVTVVSDPAMLCAHQHSAGLYGSEAESQGDARGEDGIHLQYSLDFRFSLCEPVVYEGP